MGKRRSARVHEQAAIFKEECGMSFLLCMLGIHCWHEIGIEFVDDAILADRVYLTHEMCFHCTERRTKVGRPNKKSRYNWT